MKKSILLTTLLGILAALTPAAAVADNLIIVSIGDSLAAGEGNPNSFGLAGAVWSNAPCHRSVNNGRRIAADRINDLPGVSTSFFDFSCSGASIDAGLLGPQVTNQPDAANLVKLAQVDQVANFQHSVNGLNNQQIDILIISIGVNDANFAPVVTECLKPTDCTNSPAMNLARTVIGSAAFSNAYDRLANAIRAKVNVNHIYITEYPNLVTSSPGNFCGSDPLDLGDISMAGLSSGENSFVRTNFILPLNNAIQDAAGRNGWHFVVGPEDTFATHGYCKQPSERYVNTLQDSVLSQGNERGTAHPNRQGHKGYADALIRRATIDFNLHLEDPRYIRKVEANTITPGPIADSGPKSITVEVAQHPGTLSVTLRHRVLTPILGAGDWTDTDMNENGSGRLNLFHATLPGFVPGQTVQYKFVMRAARNGESVSHTTSTASISAGDLLVQQ